MVVGQRLKIVFLGTPAFAVPSLERLLTSPHEVVAVVTQPDRPRGRGHKTTHAPVKATALSAGVPILQPETLKDPAFLDGLRNFQPDLGIVAAYGKILSQVVLDIPRLGMINVHASLLPKYRGAAPVHRAVVAGETETGITIMRVVKALDAGPMLASVKRPIGPDETSEELERQLSMDGASLLVDSLEKLAARQITEVPQTEALATYAPRLTKADGVIDWSASATAIHNQIRGLHPWPHAFTFLKGSRLILLKSSPTGAAPRSSPVIGGTIVEARGDDLLIATGGGVLRIVTLQAEGTRPMSVREFLAGHSVPPGARLTPTP